MIRELNSLLEAELAYARFNAQRTAVNASGDAITTSSDNGVSQITDRSRPTNEYYNRAVVLPDQTSVADVIPAICESVRAIELLIPLQTEENFSCLLDAGFRPSRSLCYLTATPGSSKSHDNNIVELGADQRDMFFDLLERSGASFPEEKRNASRHFYCTDTFRCFVAFDRHDQPAGWATMYINQDTAFLANAFVLPEH